MKKLRPIKLCSGGLSNVPTNVPIRLRRTPFPSTIAIDGPAASGKTTLGKRLADYLGYLFFDTGVMYRAVTWIALQRSIEIEDEAAITILAEQSIIDVSPPSQPDGRSSDVLVDGEDVTWEIRRPEVEAHVSVVSAYPGVRKALSAQQRRIGLRGEVVMVGRDIGTVVLPEADLKIYLDASVEERARRRLIEFKQRGEEAHLETILAAMRKRDQIDSTRSVAPLHPADDAVILDSDKLDAEQVLDQVKSFFPTSSSYAHHSGSTLPHYRLSLWHRAWRPVLRPAFRLLFHILANVQITGRENVPPLGGYLIAMNHVSTYDPPLVVAFWPVATEVAGAVEIWERPGQSILVRLYGGIPVHRGEYNRQLIETMVAALCSGRPVLIAPEGGRSHTPGLRRAYSGVAYVIDLANRQYPAAVPVVPVGIVGTTDDFMQRALHGDRPKVEMRIGRPVLLPPIAGSGEARRSARQQNADLIMSNIAALLPEEYRGVYAKMY